ncbi:MAG: LptF/LptG family permease, partial [Flavobacteriaceae bacterium]|nr:LptF/LptG family permease [Flavobacteriaceae bacterium]
PPNLFEFIISNEIWKKSRVMDESIVKVRSSIRNLNTKKNTFFAYQKTINLHKITLQEKYTLIFASLFLFLIGAALGAIIRKGGLGLPLVLSVLIFLTYHYIGLFGKNAAEDNSISPFFATWLSTFILAPFAIILTRRASADKGFISLSNLVYPIQEKIKILFFFKTRKTKND